MTIKDILMREDLALTRSEEKIVRLLLTDYPTSGLGTATRLARRAAVSDPTVVRLVMKLGFEGFADFQARLLAEVEQRLQSPLLMMETKRSARPEQGVVASYLGSARAVVDKSLTTTPSQSYDRAARLIMEAKGSVVLLGGRYSRHLAGLLAGYLSQFRPDVKDIGVLSVPSFDTLADLGKNDVLIVFDYRRYQRDIISYAEQAAQRKARIVLFTDQWSSPIAEHAEVTIVSPTEVASPYDTLASPLAQMEALVALIVASLDDSSRSRIEALEKVRERNAVTLDSAENPKSAKAGKKRRP
jgi:DNA-binding MurR/RpiR family transcriptional regulator